LLSERNDLNIIILTLFRQHTFVFIYSFKFEIFTCQLWGFISFLFLGCNIELEENDITIQNRVIFTALFVKTFCFDLLFSFMFFEIIIFIHFCTDKSFFKIGMDCTSCLWGFASFSNSPASDFIRSWGEEMAELEILITWFDDSVNHRRAS